MRLVVVVAAALVLLVGAGCGAEREVAATEVPAKPADVLECDGAWHEKGRGDYDSGLERVQGHPETALLDLIAQEASGLPRAGYRVVARDRGRALLTYTKDGRTTAAVVTADGMRDYADGTGWGVEAWARCAPTGWTDANGHPTSPHEIESFQGAEHCDWQEATFLVLDEDTWYVRDPAGIPDFARVLATTFKADATLPPHARNTGYRDAEGRTLHTTRDAAYLVARDGHTERWPRAAQPILCA